MLATPPGKLPKILSLFAWPVSCKTPGMKFRWLIVAAISGAGLLRGCEYISYTHCGKPPGVAETRHKVQDLSARLADKAASSGSCPEPSDLGKTDVDAWKRPFAVSCEKEYVFAISVTSPGLDGKMGTADDIRFESCAAQQGVAPDGRSPAAPARR